MRRGVLAPASAAESGELEAALDALPDAFILLDGDGRVRWANAHAALLCGRAEGTLEGKALADVLPSVLAEAILPEIAALGTGGEVRSFDLRMEQDGDWYAGHAHAAGPGIVLHLHDITRRRQVEGALAFLADAGAVLAGELDEGRLLSAVAGLIVPRFADWCLVAVRGTGDAVRRIEVVARDPRDTDRLLAPELARGRGDGGPADLIARGMATTEPVLVPFDRRVADTGWPPSDCVLLLPLPMRGGNAGTIVMGRAPGASAFRRDEIQVAHTVGRRVGLALENARLFDAAQRATALRDDVLSIVAHDLRSPLYAIVLAASAVGDERLDDVALRQTARQSILKAAERIDRLLEDLLNAARLDAGWAPREAERVAVSQLLEDTVETFRRRALLEGVRLEVRLHELGEAQVEVDADRMNEALSNLVDNALRFTPRDGTVTLSAEDTPSGLLLSVTDTGPGIDAAALPRLFDRFWQARRSGRAGAGLGLFIARRIVEGHGGSIWAESEQGRGSVFRILLPYHFGGDSGARTEPDSGPSS